MKYLLPAILLLSTIWVPQIAIAQPKIVTAAQVNGTWKSKFGTFKILALGNQKLKVEFSGVYVYTTSDGQPMANLGKGNGIARIENRTAQFKPVGAEDECAITLNFVGSGLEVKQESSCGFGLNVSSAGKYRKVSSGKPQFDN
jgi:hypothetical protein